MQRAFFNMNLSNEQLVEIINAVKYYQQRHLSIRNPRYDEYNEILEILIQHCSKLQ